MENLSKEIISLIGQYLSVLNLVNFSLVNRLTYNICKDLLNQKRIELNQYINKYGKKNIKLRQIITTLFTYQDDEDMFYRLVNISLVCRDKFNDFEFTFFRGNLYRAILKIMTLFGETDESQMNIIEIILDQGWYHYGLDFKNPHDIEKLFKEKPIDRIKIQKFKTLPELRVHNYKF